ncbi:hypothetical protein HYH03_005788 [Edaphochlamys debaryana]|uniref:BACK domain-containing protein n=1 Tax=Edaphochlamys debaryana TaxID=47281 RepID=A0A835Y566_9CHLO|nr:hypothetical protein HYH03_005788 [Edaphochlamys debaryana]|eukprot:KAG2496188.1 hypothetical protein HYH03_005788 [Edaphochlamys debaryana]
MAPPAVNPLVAEALSRLFGSEEGADCDIQFYLEGGEEGGGGAVLGPLIPAHSLVLRPACERFRAQLNRWQPSPGACTDVAPATPQGSWAQRVLRVTQAKETAGGSLVRSAHTAQATDKAGSRPLLRVPLGSEAELPAARLALRFAYTGQPSQIHASSVREALEVLRAGDYLAIEGCAAACSQWLADRLAATEAAAGSSAAPAEPAVLQLYACEELWRPSASDPSFAAVLSAAKAQLVRHFRSTLKTLNSFYLTKQLEALPAAGLEALLESDDLGTDSEDSVLTLLATWMRANWARTDAATRQRLCGLVRLTQLSPQAVSCLLLPLAADFDTHGLEQQAGWFPMTVMEAAHVVSYHSASEPWQKQAFAPDHRLSSWPGWHSTSPRKQCVPETGLHFPWSISKEELRAKLLGLPPGKTAQAYAVFGGGSMLLAARGFVWAVPVEYTHGKAAAGLFLRTQIPEAYKVPDSRLAGYQERAVPSFATCIDARLTANRRQGGEVSSASVYSYSQADFTRVGSGWGLPAALPLSAQQPIVAMMAAGGNVLAPWAEYAHEGSAVTGTLTLLPPK